MKATGQVILSMEEVKEALAAYVKRKLAICKRLKVGEVVSMTQDEVAFYIEYEEPEPVAKSKKIPYPKGYEDDEDC